MRASHNSQLQLQARSTRTCLSCLAPFGKFNYSKSHANELDGKVKQQTGRGGGERRGERERIKLRSGFPISKLHIAYVFCCLICAGIVCFLQHKLTILSPSHTHTISLSMPFPPYLPPLLALLISRGVILPRLQIQFTFLI